MGGWSTALFRHMGMSQVSQKHLRDHLCYTLAKVGKKYEDESGLPGTFISLRQWSRDMGLRMTQESKESLLASLNG